MEDDEKFDDEEERQRFEDNYHQFADRYKKTIEWQEYLMDQMAKGNQFILIPQKFTGIKNFPLCIVMLGKRKPKEEDTNISVLSMFSVILN